MRKTVGKDRRMAIMETRYDVTVYLDGQEIEVRENTNRNRLTTALRIAKITNRISNAQMDVVWERRVRTYHRNRCVQCDARPRAIEFDCDGPYETVVCLDTQCLGPYVANDRYPNHVMVTS